MKKSLTPQLERNVQLLFEVGSLKNTQRGWKQHLGECANTIEHTYRVMWIALILARMEGVKNEEKIMKMALVHDIADTRTTELSYVQKVYQEDVGDKPVGDMLFLTSLAGLFEEYKEYSLRSSIESKIVKDADNLDVDLELKELEEKGSTLPKKWSSFRKMVRSKKLYTESSKKLWDAIQVTDVASWHLECNKWLRKPNAGK